MANVNNHKCSPEVGPQTVMVKLIRGNGLEGKLRALIDSAFQGSYVLKEIVTDEGYQSVRSETTTHVLFGGPKSRKQIHFLCQMKVHSLVGNFVAEIPVLHQNVICGKILRLKRWPWE